MSDDERNGEELEGYQTGATNQPGVPSATVPGATVESHGGHRNTVERSDGTYVDGNVDERGVDAVGVRQAQIAEGSLDEAAGADTTPRTDGRGHANPAADASVPDDVHPGEQH